MSRKKLIIVITLCTFAGKLFAASEGHEASVTDLLWPFVNFSVLIAFLVNFLKKPISDAFTANSDRVKDLFESSEEKDKEAQIKLEMYQDRLDKFKNEHINIMKESDERALAYKSKTGEEVSDQIERMEFDSENKLDFEKKARIADLNLSLVNKILEITKDNVKDNKNVKDKFTSDILSELQ